MVEKPTGPSVDLDAARNFLAALDFNNSVQAPHAFWTCPADENPIQDDMWRLTRGGKKHLDMSGAFDDVLPRLLQLHQEGADVNVVLNATDPQGDVTAIRACCSRWREPPGPGNVLGVEPSLVVRSEGAFDLYWLLHLHDGDFSEHCETWLRLHAALRRQHDSTAAVRVLDFKVPVPGFSHQRSRPLDLELYRRVLEELRFKIDRGDARVAWPSPAAHKRARHEYGLRGGEFSPPEKVQLEKCDPHLRYEIGRVIRGLDLEIDPTPFILTPEMIDTSEHGEKTVPESSSLPELGDVPPPNLEDARRFVAAIDPTAERFTFQTYEDRGADSDLAHIFHGSLEQVIPAISSINARGGAVMCTINATDFRGRGNKSITSTRAFFCDWDDHAPPRGAGALPISMMVSRAAGERRKYHAYWLLSEPVDIDRWKAVQRALVQKLQADSGAILLNQALRLPGFYNCKDTPVLVELDECHSDRRYTVDQIVETYQLEPLIEAQNDPPRPRRDRTSDDGPADDYAARGDWSVLERNGWTVVFRDGDEKRWTKPGGKRGKIHATTDHKKRHGIFKCFSSKASPFVANKGYTRFQVLAELEHGGDGSAAAKALVEQGYGKSMAERNRELADAHEEARWDASMTAPEARATKVVNIDGPIAPEAPWFDKLSPTNGARAANDAREAHSADSVDAGHVYKSFDSLEESSGSGGHSSGGSGNGDGGGDGDGDGDGDGALVPQGDGNAPELWALNSVKTVAKGPDNIPMTHVGNRERFLDRYGRLVCYVKTFNCWYVWNGLRWRQDADAEETHVRPPCLENDDLSSYVKASETDPFDAGNFVMELAMQVGRSMQGLVDHIFVQERDDEGNKITGSDGKPKRDPAKTEAQRKKWVGHCVRTESEGALNQMLNLSRSNRMVARFPSYFDPYDHLINTEGGVQDLRTSLYYPHHPGYSQSKIVRIKPKRSGCPIWMRFLERVLQEDDELIRFVQRAMGYSLTGETREQVLFLLYGTGRNGKSTFLNVLHALAGEYAQHAEFSTFVERQTEMVRNDLARLHKSRLVTAVEPKSTAYMDESLIKQVTGQEVVAARFLFQEHFEYLPRFKIWLAANHKPMIRGNDEGIWRRILMVPFTVTIPEEEKDQDLPRKLVSELPSIFSWAADGARIWYEEGLQPPTAVREATKAYRDDMDSIGMFLHVRCVTLPNVRSMATALYRQYVRWTEQTGERPMSQKKFGLRLEERGIEKNRTARGYEYRGIAISENDPHDQKSEQTSMDDR